MSHARFEGAPVTTLFQDVRFAFRTFRKTPGLAVLAVATLALGIGVNSTIFSLVNAALLRPLPVDQPEQLVWVFNKSWSGPFGGTTFPEYVYYRDENEVFSGLAAYSRTPVHLANAGQAERVAGALVSGNYFTVLGVDAFLGRTFAPEEDETPGTHPVAVISYRLWKRLFGSDPRVIGRTVKLNSYPFTVVGIAPRDFTGTEVGLPYELWVPLAMSDRVSPGDNLLEQRRWDWLEIVGRLEPGVDHEKAQASMNVLAKQLARANPESEREQALTLFPLSKRSPHFRGTYLSVSTLLLAASGLVLLIACANVANMFLARSVDRRREFAIRRAMGASRLRLIRQWLTESVLLSTMGGGGGLLLALWSSDLLAAAKPHIPIPIEVNLSVDARVLGFSLLLSLVTGIAFGLAPGLQSSRSNPVPPLKGEQIFLGPHRRLSLRNFLVIAQVGLSLVLLFGAGLFLKSLYRMQAVDPGFVPDNVLIASIDLGLQGYNEVEGRAFYQELESRVGALPGVNSASLAQYVPLTNLYMPAVSTPVAIEGHEPPPEDGPLMIASNVVDLDYFRTMGTALLRGRDFTSRDTAGAPRRVIINESMAGRFWPNENAVGKRFQIAARPPQTVEVIGIVQDSKCFTLWEEPRPYLYHPLAQDYTAWATLHVRTNGDPHDLLGAVRHELRTLDKDMPVYNVASLSEALSLSLFPPRMGAVLLGAFGTLALLLAAIGIYSAMSYIISRRTHEIGVRMSLGARAGDVLRMIFRECLSLISVGVGLGLFAALAVHRLLSRFLYDVRTTDPATLLAVCLLLILIALLASYSPARRATQVDPNVALRHE